MLNKDPIHVEPMPSVANTTMTTIHAVVPYHHAGYLNFKEMPYEAWRELGGQTAAAHYPPRLLHGLAYRWELPRAFHKSGEARLRFVEPVSIHFDTFPDNARYEIVPMVWDCWPRYFEATARWLQSHNVRTAIFTSRDTARKMQEQLPEVNIMWCPEGIDTRQYSEGKPLAERSIDLLEFGRGTEGVIPLQLPSDVKYIRTKINGRFVYTEEQLHKAMADAKVSVVLPHSITNPEFSGGLETLTQRYWECMLSRIAMVGHAPQEIIDIIGYNPVVEIPVDEHAGEAYSEKIQDILQHPADYQLLVDRNRETALKLGDWKVRMRQVMEWLGGLGYEL